MPGPMIPANPDFFAEKGILKLPAFHPRARMAAIRAGVLDRLKGSSGGDATSKSFRKLPIFQQITRMSSRVAVDGAHGALLTPELLGIVAKVAGRQPTAIQPLQFLLSPPNQGAWTLEGLNWHVDVKAETAGRAPGVQVFFLIDDVAPRGGATLALAGSHKLGQDGAGPHSRLREALRSRANFEQTLRDLGLEVLEMSGRAGDVYLMDMRTLHTPAVNASSRFRMMATCRCLMD